MTQRAPAGLFSGAGSANVACRERRRVAGIEEDQAWPQDALADEFVVRMQFMLDLRRRGISDQAVLRAMDEVPREHFVEARSIDEAYADRALPIACGQTISQPYRRRLHDRAARRQPRASRARGRHRLRLSGRRAVAAGARGGEHRALPHAGGRSAQPARDARLRNVEVRVGDGLPACRSGRHTTASSSLRPPKHIPEQLVDQLADTGVMLLPLGPHDGAQQLVKLTKSKEGIGQEDLIGVRFVPLLPGQAREL